MLGDILGQMPTWEETLSSWTKPASDLEEKRCEEVESAIRQAIKAHSILEEMNISVFAQGSWRANTNVRKNSDVDVCIRLNSTCFVTVPEGSTLAAYGYSDSKITFQWYKNEIENALASYFGKNQVTRGNKAFDIHGLGVDADAVPALMYHNYKGSAGQAIPRLDGIAFDTDSGERVINYPEQALQNGIDKNKETGRAYKRCVRILKRARNLLQSERVRAAENNPSFQIESLLYNLDDRYFAESTWQRTLEDVLRGAYSAAKHSPDPKEVNGIKPLFGVHSSWTRDYACGFLDAVWRRLGYAS